MKRFYMKEYLMEYIRKLKEKAKALVGATKAYKKIFFI